MTSWSADAPSTRATLGRKRRAAALAALLICAASSVAQGQEAYRRSGAERQVVVQLAYALGEAHALHRLCAGPADATWYARMQRLEAQEAVDDAAHRQLVDAFNAGFAARQAQFPTCSRRSRATERVVAEQGAALARRLAAPDAEQP